MTTTMTPPPLPPQPAAPPPGAGAPTPPRRTSSTVVAIIAIVAGAVLIVGAIAGSAFAAVRSTAVRTETFTAAVNGITGFDVDVSAADLTIIYGDVDQAQLVVEGTPGDWSFERDGDELSVRTDRSWFGGWSFGRDGGDSAVLTLPSALERGALDASLSLSAGSITADGTYGELDVDLDAGAIDVSGTAAELDVDVSAGRTSLDLAGVRTAEMQVSAGALDGRLRRAPDALTIDVSAGRVTLELPDETYRVVSDVEAGGFDNRLDTSAAASSQISVTVSAGQVVLRPVR
ncbi:DUF4097 domain-containing protein [Microbacterium sp. W1N]|uniref:DUF4097 domain-containing protein n=1 Tax=Microbacterium festucae TaxID=2977531 RepID=UPI0021BF7A38|nr:DUF4097 domain-containing protein [Microbacterium festucae]MCT9820693.1 DUF4097 domain-containing protein [Microbacterium festucae]